MAVKLSNLKDSCSLTQDVEQNMPKVGVSADALDLEIAPHTPPNEASPLTASRVALKDLPQEAEPKGAKASTDLHLLIAAERPKSRADKHVASSQYPLGARIYPVLFHFIRQIEGVKNRDNPTSPHDLTALGSFFEEMYTSFKRVSDFDLGLGFTDFMREFFSKITEYDQVKRYSQGHNHGVKPLEHLLEEMYTIFKRVRKLDATVKFADFMRDFFLKRAQRKPNISISEQEIENGDLSISQHDLQALGRSFEEMYTVFKRVRKLDTESGFADFMREFFSKMGQHKQIKSYLTHWNIPIFAQEIENEEDSTSQDGLQALERFFEEMCTVFKRARECNTELEFADFMREFFSKITQHEQVKNDLIDHNISMSAQAIANWDGFVGRHDLKALALPFEEMYTVFKRARKLETELGFADFMRNLLLKMMECEQVKNYLKDRNISIYAYSNQKPESKCSVGEAPQICIRVGNFVQTATLCEEKVRLSRLQQVDRKEDTPSRFDATVWLFDPSDDDQNRQLSVMQRSCRWLRMKSGKILITSISIAALAGGFFWGFRRQRIL